MSTAHAQHTDVQTQPNGLQLQQPALKDQLDLSAFTELSDAPALLRAIEARFGSRATVASSFGVEDVVLMHLASVHAPSLRFFTLDTGRQFPETYAVMDAVQRRFRLRIETYVPDATAVETLVAEKGHFSFRASVEDRKACCRIRKVEPLKRALAGADAWVTGLRRDQADSRATVDVVGFDDAFGLWKFNPLATWSSADVWGYVKEHHLPYNALHDVGYASIGCAPCTRAVRPFEDPRAGRWWWEITDQKECGLHAR
jgi:phosphoadenosine phosphosulfate reductase